ncbi:MAG TPA: hypothetical protein VNV66_07795 [Pilimelia sp.]|nr:hypothetical protein [Pilimelia sp.]
MPAESSGPAEISAPGERPASGVAPRDPVPQDPARPAAPAHRPAPEDAGGRARRPRGPGRQLAAGVTALQGARSELRRQMREQKRVRILTLVVASVLLLGALPLYFGIRTATRDPVFTTLDSLEVPGWAATATQDQLTGSRWCIIECRYRERRVESARGPDETAAVYERALADSGWQRWQVALCPDQPDVEGHYTCWRRDEYTLDLWVREPTCAEDPLRNRPTVGPTEGAGVPGLEPCAGSVVSVKVRNAIGDDRGRPAPSEDPELTGEDPDPLLTGEPFDPPTPTPS